MITIIGAGAAGNYAAYLLAGEGFDVEVYEANSTVGLPVACTGIITSHFDTLIKPKKELIANTVESARIYSPNGENVKINFRHPNKIFNRHLLDQHVAEMAQRSGAEYKLNHVYMGNRPSGDMEKVMVKDLKSGEEYETETKMLIGADGPASRVAKNNGLYGKRKLYLGLQATAKRENDNMIDFYPGTQGIAWTVPESKDRVRIGVATLNEPQKYFEGFCRKVLGEDYAGLILARQAGPIPLYDPNVKTQNGNVYTVGDAATMVKATTLGGIMQSHIAAKALAESITHRKNYSRLWRSRLARDLWLHLMMRKAMDKFTDYDYNKLVGIFQKERNRKILEEHDRDFPARFMAKLLAGSPELLGFARLII